MKTSVIEVHDMLSVLSVDEVENRIGKVPGVESVTVNHAAANATVRYDETRLEVGDIKSAVRQLGYEPDPPKTGAAGKGHEDHKAPGAPPSTPAAAPKPSPGAPAAAPPPSVPPAAPASATPAPSPSPMPPGDQQKAPAKG